MDVRELTDATVVADGLTFPEGPVALADGSVLVVEIFAGLLTRIDPEGTKLVIADLGGGPNGAAMGPDGALYVCNNGGIRGHDPTTPGIQRVDLDTGAHEYVYTASGGRPLVAPNDLIFDATGNFWFTDFRGGSIHYAAPDGTDIATVARRQNFPNGIGLSPAGDIVYWAQTHTRDVIRRRLTAPGTPAATPGHTIGDLMREGTSDSWTLLASMPGLHELDSLAIDSSGAVCVGTLVTGGIAEIPADGNPDDIVLWKLPAALDDPAVTNICFAGPDLTTAYLTCSLTGRLMRCTWHRPGLALHGSTR